jgi:glycosyltransferase involved in cell wall biosynthesis
LHDEPPSAARQSLRRLDAIVTISDALRRDVVQLVGDPNRVVVEHDGVDLSRVSRLTREAARNQLGLTDVAGPLVVYTGRAIAGKGVDVLLEAAPRIAELAGAVVIVGRVYEPEYLQHASDAVRFVGFVPPAAVADYLAAADVLVLPTTPSLPYAEYTSPLKLFEYMAAERPIVASDLPVLREVLRDGENALLYPPDDATALASAVERAWSDASLAQRLAAKALEDVDTYSWDSRAKRIVDLLERVAR